MLKIMETDQHLKNMEGYSKSFGKKQSLLDVGYRYYRTRAFFDIGAVADLIRDCQPSSIEEWRSWYFANAYTTGENPTKITVESLNELGKIWYNKIILVLLPEWVGPLPEGFSAQDCIDYIYDLAINRTYDDYMREKSVVR